MSKSNNGNVAVSPSPEELLDFHADRQDETELETDEDLEFEGEEDPALAGEAPSIADGKGMRLGFVTVVVGIGIAAVMWLWGEFNPDPVAEAPSTPQTEEPEQVTIEEDPTSKIAVDLALADQEEELRALAEEEPETEVRGEPPEIPEDPTPAPVASSPAPDPPPSPAPPPPEPIRYEPPPEPVEVDPAPEPPPITEPDPEPIAEEALPEGAPQPEPEPEIDPHEQMAQLVALGNYGQRTVPGATSKQEATAQTAVAGTRIAATLTTPAVWTEDGTQIPAMAQLEENWIAADGTPIALAGEEVRLERSGGNDAIAALQVAAINGIEVDPGSTAVWELENDGDIEILEGDRLNNDKLARDLRNLLGDAARGSLEEVLDIDMGGGELERLLSLAIESDRPPTIWAVEPGERVAISVSSNFEVGGTEQ